MNLTPQERAILDVFDHETCPKLRFQQIACAILRADERVAAARGLVQKGLLAPLAGGEYWITDEGLEFVSS